MAELKNLDKLNIHVRERIEPYCREMIEIHGDNLKSICVYGSSTGVDFVQGKSNINLLIIMERIDPPDLKKSLSIVKKGMKRDIVAPLMLTVDYMKTSSDVFPIEFLEMKGNYILIYGLDLLKDLKIEDNNLRLECEEQLKGGLVRMYQTYLEVGLNEKRISELMAHSITSFFPVMRNILRLRGEAPPLKKNEIIRRISSISSVNSNILDQVLELKNTGKTKGNLEKLFGDYLEEIERLTVFIEDVKRDKKV